MGPNGSGKTTLLKNILGLVIPEKGKITVNEIDISKNFEYRKLIGYMPQTAYYPENLKVKEVISIISEVRGKESAKDIELLELFRINELYNKRISSLSQGTRQRLSGALAFMFDSEIIILDEPTAGLDPASSGHMKEKIMKESRKGKLILVTTHIINEVETIAERLVFMLEGKIHIVKKIDRNNPGKNGSGLASEISKLFEKYEWQ